MAGFERREIEYMQALCIYNKYIECYSVKTSLHGQSLKYVFDGDIIYWNVPMKVFLFDFKYIAPGASTFKMCRPMYYEHNHKNGIHNIRNIITSIFPFEN